MWNLPKGELFLPKVSIRTLEAEHAKEQNNKAKSRLLVAIHRKNDKSIDQISSLTHQKRRTIHEWLWKFQEHGISGKDSIKQTGRPARLTAKQIQELVKALERGPPHNPNGLWTSKEVREFIRKKYKISFVPQHIWRILQSLGFTIQRPRKRHYKAASIEEIRRFKKTPNRRHDTTERKVLLWPQKMKQHLA